MFFLTKDTVPEGVGFSTFGTTHLLWLLAIVIIWFTGIFIYLKSADNKRRIMRIVVGCIVVFLELSKDLVDLLRGDLTAGNLPLHLCGINILLIAFDLFKESKINRNFLYYFCIPGALLALLFPNWTVLPCFNFSHIHSFLIHAFLVLYPLMLVCSGELSPEIKMMPKCILLLILMAIPIYFVNLVLDTNFMFLMEPETGNPLGLFEKYLGSHLWGFPVLLPLVMLLMYLPILISSKLKKKSIELKEEKTYSVVK